MMRRVRRWLMRLAIRLALRTKAPNNFTFDADTDYSIAHLVLKGSGRQILVDACGGEGVRGRLWDRDAFRIGVRLNERALDSFGLTVKQFIGYRSIEHDGIISVLIAYITLYRFRVRVGMQLGEFLAHRSAHFIADRMHLLSRLIAIEESFAESSRGLVDRPTSRPVTEWFTLVYGTHAYTHPKFKAESYKFRILIESFVSSGELFMEKGFYFRVEPKAWASFANFALADRRHRDNVRMQRVLSVLTAALVAVGIIPILI